MYIIVHKRKGPDEIPGPAVYHYFHSNSSIRLPNGSLT